MKITFLYPPSGYLNHSMFKHFTYFGETIHLISQSFPETSALDCAVEMKSRQEIYEAFSKSDCLIVLIEPYNIQAALSLSQICKDINENCKTIFYGTAATLVPHFLARQSVVDFVITNGEFVQGILDILNWLTHDNHNGPNDFAEESHSFLVSSQIGQAAHTWGCALDAPVPLSLYKHFGNNMFEFTVQIGCPFSCTFCSEKILFPTTNKISHAQRPIDNIISVLKRLRGQFNSVYFSATTFTYDKLWVTELCEEMCRQNCILPWRTDTRIDYLDADLIEKMQQAGLIQLSIGVESFEDHLLTNVNKRQTAKTLYEQILMCKELGVKIKALLILGIPGQTAEDVLHTQEIIDELGIPYRWKEYSPIRELHQKDLKNLDISGEIDNFNRNNFNSNHIPDLSPQKYMQLLFPYGYQR